MRSGRGRCAPSARPEHTRSLPSRGRAGSANAGRAACPGRLAPADARLPTLARRVPGPAARDRGLHEGSICQQCHADARGRPAPVRGHGVGVVVATLIVAACGATVPPSLTTRPTDTAAARPRRSRAAARSRDGLPRRRGRAVRPERSHRTRRTPPTRATSSGSPPRTRPRSSSSCAPPTSPSCRRSPPRRSRSTTRLAGGHIEPAVGHDQAIVTAVNGTGPYRLERWDPGAEVSLARNDGLLGRPGQERAGHRPLDRRLRATRRPSSRRATVDGIDDVAPAGVAIVDDDVALQLQSRPGLDIVYLGLNDAIAPFGDERVRQALAMGIDRQRLTDQFFPPGAEVAVARHPLRDPERLRRRPVVRIRSAPGQGAARRRRPVERVRHDDPLSGGPDRRPPRPGRPRGSSSRPSSSTTWASRAELVAEPVETYLADVAAGKLDGIHLLEPRRRLPGRQRVSRPALRAGCVEGVRQALRRHRQGARDRSRPRRTRRRARRRTRRPTT